MPGPSGKHHLLNRVRDASENWKRQWLQQFANNCYQMLQLGMGQRR